MLVAHNQTNPMFTKNITSFAKEAVYEWNYIYLIFALTLTVLVTTIDALQYFQTG